MLIIGKHGVTPGKFCTVAGGNRILLPSHRKCMLGTQAWEDLKHNSNIYRKSKELPAGALCLIHNKVTWLCPKPGEP